MKNRLFYSVLIALTLLSSNAFAQELFNYPQFEMKGLKNIKLEHSRYIYDDKMEKTPFGYLVQEGSGLLDKNYQFHHYNKNFERMASSKVVPDLVPSMDNEASYSLEKVVYTDSKMFVFYERYGKKDGMASLHYVEVAPNSLKKMGAAKKIAQHKIYYTNTVQDRGWFRVDQSCRNGWIKIVNVHAKTEEQIQEISVFDKDMQSLDIEYPEDDEVVNKIPATYSFYSPTYTIGDDFLFVANSNEATSTAYNSREIILRRFYMEKDELKLKEFNYIPKHDGGEFQLKGYRIKNGKVAIFGKIIQEDHHCIGVYVCQIDIETQKLDYEWTFDFQDYDKSKFSETFVSEIIDGLNTNVVNRQKNILLLASDSGMYVGFERYNASYSGSSQYIRNEDILIFYIDKNQGFQNLSKIDKNQISKKEKTEYLASKYMYTDKDGALKIIFYDKPKNVSPAPLNSQSSKPQILETTLLPNGEASTKSIGVLKSNNYEYYLNFNLYIRLEDSENNYLMSITNGSEAKWAIISLKE
ncbi:MAG: hypothetical protein H6607_00045 [Flavobacteriales bacterium]|nr:hypothetical protein [Flavobacteriales bacterium]